MRPIIPTTLAAPQKTPLCEDYKKMSKGRLHETAVTLKLSQYIVAASTKRNTLTSATLNF